ncbi:metallophosphoesterase [Rhodopirellula sp. JC740]|uniref:Metallophosphoesterase n=1 Tax=Rhodopirellula halodulae TaxID=2894198 RepID=A0ABS8NNI0_9BACT|nr:metallophosphoesterase [Rhodopirellula sp. JC740]MCC9645143.1 metallophosphoesterase [Rhodopirellula sp. JC740]
MNNVLAHTQPIPRRTLLQHGSLWLAASAPIAKAAFAVEKRSSEAVRIGLVTDLHHADKAPGGSRHYRDTTKKLAEAAKQFRSSSLDCLVELGDLIDAAKTVDTELGYLETINGQFREICKDRHYVLGNHCVDTLKKSEFLEGVGQERSYYSFDRKGIHFIVLDACFREDGVGYERKNFHWTDANIPPAELDWLRKDLKSNEHPVVVLAHQRLDVSDHHGVKNNAVVRDVLEQSGNVKAVFQGHSHQNALKQINGIHYCTLAAMVEGKGIANNGYSVMDVYPDGSIHLEGFMRQSSYDWNS